MDAVAVAAERNHAAETETMRILAASDGDPERALAEDNGIDGETGPAVKALVQQLASAALATEKAEQDAAHDRARTEYEEKGDLASIAVFDWVAMSEAQRVALTAQAEFGATGNPPESDPAVLYRLSRLSGAELAATDPRQHKSALNAADYQAHAARHKAAQAGPGAPETPESRRDRVTLRETDGALKALNIDFATSKNPAHAVAANALYIRNRDDVAVIQDANQGKSPSVKEIRESAIENAAIWNRSLAMDGANGPTAGSTKTAALDSALARFGKNPESADEVARIFNQGMDNAAKNAERAIEGVAEAGPDANELLVRYSAIYAALSGQEVLPVGEGGDQEVVVQDSADLTTTNHDGSREQLVMGADGVVYRRRVGGDRAGYLIPLTPDEVDVLINRGAIDGEVPRELADDARGATIASAEPPSDEADGKDDDKPEEGKKTLPVPQEPPKQKNPQTPPSKPPVDATDAIPFPDKRKKSDAPDNETGEQRADGDGGAEGGIENGGQDGGSRKFDVGSIDKKVKGRKIVQPTDSVEDLLKGATDMKPGFDEGLQEIGAAVPGVEVVPSRVKEEGERLMKKIGEFHDDMRENGFEPSHSEAGAHLMEDYLGGRLILETPAQLDPILREIGRRYKIVNTKDFLTKPNPRTGYWGYHVQVRLLNGMTAELQIQPRPLADANEVQRPIYLKWRDKKPPYSAQEEKQFLADMKKSRDILLSAYEEWLKASR